MVRCRHQVPEVAPLCDSSSTAANPIRMASRAPVLTPSPSRRNPTIAVWITSVFLKVMPTAKLRSLNSSTTASVAKICVVPPNIA